MAPALLRPIIIGAQRLAINKFLGVVDGLGVAKKIGVTEGLDIQTWGRGHGAMVKLYLAALLGDVAILGCLLINLA